MRLDQNPVFRKIIVPWYDSDTICYVLIILMALVILLGLTGISFCREIPEYQGHLWVPLLLLYLIGSVLLSASIRMIKRHFRQSNH